LGITPIKYNKIRYSREKRYYFTSENEKVFGDGGEIEIVCSELRQLLERGETPPSWIMREGIWEMIKNELVDNNPTKGKL